MFPSIHMERMVLRTDGFVSLNAGYRGGEVVTRPLTFKGSTLTLNFATSAAGNIRVEIQDEAGRALPGFALEESPLVWGDEYRANGALEAFPRQRHLGRATEAHCGQTGPATTDDEGRRPVFITVSLIWMRLTSASS